MTIDQLLYVAARIHTWDKSTMDITRRAIDIVMHCEMAAKEQKEMSSVRDTREARKMDEDIRIGHSGDALQLLEEMIEHSQCIVSIHAGYYLVRLKALKDAIERGIIG